MSVIIIKGKIVDNTVSDLNERFSLERMSSKVRELGEDEALGYFDIIRGNVLEISVFDYPPSITEDIFDAVLEEMDEAGLVEVFGAYTDADSETVYLATVARGEMIEVDLGEFGLIDILSKVDDGLDELIDKSMEMLLKPSMKPRFEKYLEDELREIEAF